MLDLAKHIVNQKSGRFEPDKFENHYETALVDLVNSKRSGKPIVPNERPRARERRRSHGRVAQERRRRGGQTKAPKKSAKKPRKATAGQKEMLMPIDPQKPAKEAAAKKPAASQQRKSA
jgi:DNA end-binding protein Ku